MIRRTLEYQPLIVGQLKAEIAKLQSEKELLRLYLHELIEAFYKTVNQPLKNQESKILCLKCLKSYLAKEKYE